MRTLLLGSALLALTIGTGCKKEKQEEDISALLESDPAKAIPKLQDMYAADSSDYTVIRQLADAHTRTTPPNWERAAAYFRAALEHPKGQEKEEQRGLRGAVLTCIEHQIKAGKAANLEARKLDALLFEANDLERILAKQDIKAGKELFARARKKFDSLVEAKNYAGALKFMGQLDRIYVDEATMRTVTDQKPRLLVLQFDALTLKAFAATVQGPATEAGLYDAEQKALALVSVGKVPVETKYAEDGTTPIPPPADMAQRLEEQLCGRAAAIPRLQQLLDPLANASPLGRALDEAELGALFDLSKRKRKTRWKGEVWDAAKVYPAGHMLEFECADSLTLDDLVTFLRGRARPDAPKKE